MNRGLITRAVAALGCAALLALAAGLADAAGIRHHRSHGHRAAHRLKSAARHRKHHRRLRPIVRQNQPNIVFVLTDDLSMNLLQFMPNLQAVQRDGMTFNNYFVTDSLCCPSRASIFTGDLPHNTRIFSNGGKHGGFDQFYARGEEQHTFAVALKRAGYRTAMMGKYLNGYMGTPNTPAAAPATYVPPGWSTWDVVGWGYPEYDYILNHNGSLWAYGDQPSDYLTDVLSNNAVDFIDSSAAARKPFFLEVATFAPHSPYTPAVRNSGDFAGLKAPQLPSFNSLPANAPGWLANRSPLTTDQIAQIDSAFRSRAQAVEGVDQMIGRIKAALQANGVQGDTYLVFSSDNGFHMGEYRLMPGKMTAFDTDVRVPLIVQGPGVPGGSSTDAMSENIDLAKTFAAIGGSSIRDDGHSLLPFLNGQQPLGWRDAVLVEHRGHDLRIADPDFQAPVSGNPPSYEAMRTQDFLYVEYKDGEREYYDLRSDPYELNNLAPYLSPVLLSQLHYDLLAMERCRNGSACWAAMHVEPVTGNSRRPRARTARGRRRHADRSAGSR